MVVQQVQWSAGFFLGGIHPLQGHSGGCSLRQDYKNSTSVLPLQASGGDFFRFLLGIKRFQNQNSWDHKIPNLREMWIAKFINPKTLDQEILWSRNLMIARFDYLGVMDGWAQNALMIPRPTNGHSSPSGGNHAWSMHGFACVVRSECKHLSEIRWSRDLTILRFEDHEICQSQKIKIP